MRRWIYVLRLLGSSIGGHHAPNWYIGQTNDIPSRIQEHWTGQGSKWTQLYPPVSVVECTEVPNGDATGFEIAKFTEYAIRYSWQRVRGGSFTRVDCGPPPWWDPTGLRRKNKKVKDGEPHSTREEDGVPRENHQKWEVTINEGGVGGVEVVTTVMDREGVSEDDRRGIDRDTKPKSNAEDDK